VLDELKIGITDLVEHHKDTQIPLNETASVARVCFTVEKILHIGLKGTMQARLDTLQHVGARTPTWSQIVLKP
jgi:hypothetical protein